MRILSRDTDAAPGEWANFNKLWTGETVSQFGTEVTVVALPLLALIQLHATTFQVGLISSAEYVAYSVLGLVAGVYADRWRRRRLLLVTNVARAVVTMLVPLLALAGLLTMWQVLVFALIVGVLTLFFDVTIQAYLPALVSRENLISGNTKLQTTYSTVRLVGRGSGGVIVQVLGAANALWFDAVSYLISAFAIRSIREASDNPHAGPAPSTRPEGMRKQISEGIRYLRQDPVLKSLLGSVAQFNIIITAEQALTVVFLVRTLHAPAALIGVLLVECRAIDVTVMVRFEL